MTREGATAALRETEAEIIRLKGICKRKYGSGRGVVWPADSRRRLVELRDQAKAYRAILNGESQ